MLYANNNIIGEALEHDYILLLILFWFTISVISTLITFKKLFPTQ